MILRLSDALARALVVVASVLAAAWLCFYGIRTAFAQYGAEGDTARRLELAVRLEPRNPAYWYSLGRYWQYNLEQPDSEMAERDYRNAIALNPLATDAWLDLGTAYELDGKIPEAREAYINAKKSYPSSADVSWRYGNFLLRQGEQIRAYTEMRRAIEADPQRAAAAFSRAYRSNPDIEEIINQLLPARKSVYVDVVAEAASEGQLAVAQTVWARLRQLEPRLTIRDFDGFVADLLQGHEYSQASQVWNEGAATMDLPSLFQPLGSVVWDPSFESGIVGHTFSWGFSPQVVQGVSIGLDRTEHHSGAQSLRLSFDGKHNPDLEAACTMTVVQPDTTYHFSAWTKLNNITTTHGISFRVRSWGTPAPPALKTSEVHGTAPWTILEDAWTTGPDTHQAVVCVTREPSDNPEVRISGTAWVDDVNLVPVPLEPKTAERKPTQRKSTGLPKP